MAQEASPTGNGTWTLVTAPSVNALQDGVRSLSGRAPGARWRATSRRWMPATDKVVSMPATRFDFIETQPFSLSNYRLIVANWLSANALSYAVAC